MQSWVSDADITQVIMPEVNRIWAPAKITFTLDQVVLSKSPDSSQKQSLIRGIVNSHRDEKGRSDPKRIKKLNKLIDWSMHRPEVINIYLVPYLGEKSQGNAKSETKRIFVGQWTDKKVQSTQGPEKFQLVEQGAFKKGSLSRTVAHEIGHILGLKHPDRASEHEFNRLMGGKKAGYALTSEELQTARRKAMQLGP